MSLNSSFAAALRASALTPATTRSTAVNQSNIQLGAGNTGSALPTSALNRTVREAALTEVHKEQVIAQNRKKNVVSGMIPIIGMSDAELFQKLCCLHSNITVDVVNSRRLGKPGGSKQQPLLVTLGHVEQAADVLASALELRYTYDDQIKRSIFINADLTPTEARVAFELRNAKRLRRLAHRCHSR